MIAFIKGKIRTKTEKSLIIETTGGVGYRVFCSSEAINKIFGEKAELFTHLVIRRETIELYGFLTAEEAELFHILNEISGVGPRSALALSSFGSLEKLKQAAESQDKDVFTGIKGIGTKRMQKIILEITGKIKELKKNTIPLEKDEALEALITLGFTHDQAQLSLERVPKSVVTAEEKIKEALKYLAGN